jgi:hypothetical protein
MFEADFLLEQIGRVLVEVFGDIFFDGFHESMVASSVNWRAIFYPTKNGSHHLLD